MGGKWPYNCRFVGCCFKDLFNITRSILVQFPSSFFSMRFVSVHVVHPYCSIDTTAAWKKSIFILSCPVGWGCRIHQLHFCRGVTPPMSVLIYDIKQPDGEVPVMLELWGMRSTPSLPLLPGPLWPGVVTPDRALSMA